MQYSILGHSRDIYTMFPPVTLIQRSFEMMAAWLMFAGSAAFLRWVQVCCTRRFLPVQAMWFFCEVMDMLLLADAIWANVTFPNSKKVCRTHRFLLVVLIQSLFEVTDVLLHVAATLRGNAKCQLWSRECHTPRFPRVLSIHSFSEVMGVLLLVDRTSTDKAAFLR